MLLYSVQTRVSLTLEGEQAAHFYGGRRVFLRDAWFSDLSYLNIRDNLYIFDWLIL